MSIISYRPDIDGLRAVAVLSVLIFHLDNKYLTGGFLGVDVFFVISGFLITKIILKEVYKGTFTFSSFYVRRAKRLLPPLFFVLLITTIAAFIILLPYDFYKYGISLMSVLSFVSNLQYALRRGDYFSGDSAEWPLLHTWSLAVEEQYYFILPFIVFLVFKIGKEKLLITFTLIAVGSFIVAESLSRSDNYSAISYYIIITRMGELLVGSILASLQLQNKIQPWKSESLTALSIGFVLFLIVFVDKSMPFPGFIALALCIPVAIIINSENTIANRVLGSRSLVFVGLISYSLYLTHWPVLAFGRYILNTNGGEYTFSYLSQVLLLTVIFSSALFSYYFIEQPLRKLSVRPIKILLFYFIFPTIGFVLVATYIITTKGAPSRIDGNIVKAGYQYTHIDKEKCPSIVNLGCVGGKKDSLETVILYGNSHAEHYFEYVSKLVETYDRRLLLYAAGGCSIINPSAKCRSVKSAFEDSKFQADIIIIGFRYDNSYDGKRTQMMLSELIKELISENKKVFVLAQPPLLTSSPSKLANCNRLGINCDGNLNISDEYPKYNNVIKNLTEAAGATFVDPFEYLANPLKIKNGEIYYYSDFDHLSVYGSDWLFDETANPVAKLIFDEKKNK